MGYLLENELLLIEQGLQMISSTLEEVITYTISSDTCVGSTILC